MWVSRSDFAAVEGFAYEPGRSRRLDVRLERAGALVRLVARDSGAVLVEASGDEVRRMPRMGRLPSEVVLPRGWHFKTPDHEGVDALMGSAPGAKRHHWERAGPHLVLVVVALVASVYAMWRWGLDVMVAGAILLTPPAIPAAIDRANLEALDQAIANESGLSATEKADVQAIFARLLASLPPEEADGYRLEMRDIPRVGPNAFAMPGGTVVVTDALVLEFTDEDLIAGVLGHEIAHVREQHSLQQLYRSLSIYVLVGLIAGDVGPVLEDALLEGSLLLSLAYSREHEREADAEGVALARQAGYDPEGLVRFFEALAKMTEGNGGVPQWLSTHPASAERVETIRQIIAGGG